jgi:Fe2+ transport system protein FeoA
LKSTLTAKDTERLSAVATGESVQIRSMDGGHTFLSRLASLGFTPQTRLRVVQNYGHGPIIVVLRDTRIALGRGEASKIIVDRIPRGDRGA